MTPRTPLLGRPPREDSRRTARSLPQFSRATLRWPADTRPLATVRKTKGGAA
jgi:hypothetical protein